MTITEIRAALAAIVRGVDGIAECSEYPPSSVNAVPAAWLGAAQAEVVMGQNEVWAYTLPLTVGIHRKSVLGQEIEATERLLEPVMGAIRAAYTLPGTMGLNVVAFREGPISAGGDLLTGWTITLAVKTKTARTLT